MNILQKIFISHVLQQHLPVWSRLRGVWAISHVLELEIFIIKILWLCNVIFQMGGELMIMYGMIVFRIFIPIRDRVGIRVHSPFLSLNISCCCLQNFEGTWQDHIFMVSGVCIVVADVLCQHTCCLITSVLLGFILCYWFAWYVLAVYMIQICFCGSKDKHKVTYGHFLLWFWL